MKHYFKQIIIIFSCIGLLVNSSCDFLDVSDKFDDTLQLDSVFARKIYLEKYLWGTAALLPDESDLWSTPYYPSIYGSDEGFTMWESDYEAQRFLINDVTPDNIRHMDIWGKMYKIIRKSNTILQRIGECTDLSSQDKREFVGYTYFLRAYAYYFLIVNYGPCVLVGDNIYETSLEPDAYQIERSTLDECVEYTCQELGKAAEYLPVNVPINMFGRPTKGAAYGLIAKLRVYHASPAYNGGKAARKYFSDFKRKRDKVNYISQTYDEKKWAIAADACKKVMDMGIYKLYTVNATPKTPPLPEGITYDDNFYKPYPEGAEGIDHLNSYAQMFNGEAIPFKNEEIVFGKMAGWGMNRGMNYAFPTFMGGWNCLSIPLHIIDGYRMVDGRTINNSSEKYPYSEEGFTTKLITFSGYELRQDISNMFINREMRFYASIGFSGCLWTARSTTETGKYDQVIRYGADQNSGISSAVQGDKRNYPITGFVPKKYIHPEDAFSGSNASLIEKPFIMIRYADILLMYAECLNNLTQSHKINGRTYSRDVDEISSAFNQVRYRAGLPGLTNEELNSPELFFKTLVTERMIEFLHEGLRYYDTRRWGITEEIESHPLMGLDTEKPEKLGFYSRVICNYKTIRDRIFLPKMMLLPINKQEIRRVPTLDQNPGWDD